MVGAELVQETGFLGIGDQIRARELLVSVGSHYVGSIVYNVPVIGSHFVTIAGGVTEVLGCLLALPRTAASGS